MENLFHVVTNAKTGEVTQRPFTQAEIDAYNLANQPKPPAVVSMRQAQLVLLQSGYFLAVDNYMATNASLAEKIEWNRASIVDRNSPLVANLALMLGLSESQLDSLFTLANSL